MRKVFIFGNGLGMSISADAYNLTSAMSKVWESGSLDEAQKHLISACLPEDVTQPSSEEEMATLQDTVSACEVLLRIRDDGTGHWLTDQGRDFPNAVNKFSFLVARDMFLAEHREGEGKGQKCALPDDFLKALIDDIAENQSHVATLNYDGLLSNALEHAGLLAGANPAMLDGFKNGRFDRTNLFRKNNLGSWYLHLHGCPLFVDRGKSAVHKLSPRSLSRAGQSFSGVGKHIVLTHFSHKPKIIENSQVLSIYWEFLEMAIEQSEKVLLFGYSGNDAHLNRLISQIRRGKQIEIAEWLGAGNKKAREGFWENQLGGAIKLTLLEDVLSFKDW